MKITSPLLLSLSCFLILFAFTTKPFPTVAAQPVLDTDGEPLRWYTSYYVLPHNFSLGGGLSLGTLNNKTRPLYVTQEISEVEIGFPVKFLPVSSNYLASIDTFSPLNIQTIAAASRLESLVWKLVEESNGLWFVSTKGINDRSSTFTIEKNIEVPGAYTIVTCEGIGMLPVCRHLESSHFVENGKRYITVGSIANGFTVVFKKAPGPRTTSSKCIPSVAME
ncbi:Kunitz-type trypsin inhibitor [Quillaja saponaria]|uniref:Kunitz-type trypsin inhibitor n=1 Tax=Quillaja saponaria TaxID=32244 RepID=A0AAD7Q5T3_QUISA|nr:Kunitz-type trypsin inhibitor [Quillaja saponaria]KAJ7975418.1 Kunitz-type trypsin inhibitor [Quillaja saponaria]